MLLTNLIGLHPPVVQVLVDGHGARDFNKILLLVYSFRGLRQSHRGAGSTFCGGCSAGGAQLDSEPMSCPRGQKG